MTDRLSPGGRGGIGWGRVGMGKYLSHPQHHSHSDATIKGAVVERCRNLDRFAHLDSRSFSSTFSALSNPWKPSFIT